MHAGDITQDVSPLAQIDATCRITGKGRLSVDRYSRLGAGVIIDLGSGGSGWVHIGRRVNIKPYVVIRAYDGFVEIGNRSSIGEFSLLAGHGGIRVGTCALLASHCSINATSHIVEGEEEYRFQGETAQGIAIGSGAWIGTHAVVLDGTTIGRRAIIGAGSVVKIDVPDGGRCVGVPGRIVHRREVQ